MYEYLDTHPDVVVTQKRNFFERRCVIGRVTVSRPSWESGVRHLLDMLGWHHDKDGYDVVQIDMVYYPTESDGRRGAPIRRRDPRDYRQ